jgi:hypothetical protein
VCVSVCVFVCLCVSVCVCVCVCSHQADWSGAEELDGFYGNAVFKLKTVASALLVLASVLLVLY